MRQNLSLSPQAYYHHDYHGRIKMLVNGFVTDHSTVPDYFVDFLKEREMYEGWSGVVQGGPPNF